MASSDQMDRVVNLAKRRGLVFPSSEIYGGFRSTWDYGPLGVLLKRNVKEAWWRAMVQERDDIVGLDSSILMAPAVWEASGHLQTFTDPLVDCRQCKERFRADQLPPSGACPNCGEKDSFTDARNFNLMFKTHVGPVEDDAAVAYLRPETAQGIFVNFANVQTTSRKKPPFGIAQIGKSFRNEITPGTSSSGRVSSNRWRWSSSCRPRTARSGSSTGVSSASTGTSISASRSTCCGSGRTTPTSCRTTAAGPRTSSLSIRGGGASWRASPTATDFDLKAHASHSGQDLSYFDQEHDRRYVPHVIEPAAGADRTTLAFLLAAYQEEEAPTADGKVEKRTVLKLDPRLAPIKVAVLPLSKKEDLVALTDRVAGALRRHFMIDVDVTGSIGRRYRRQDEVGTPLCVTVDFDTLEDDAVTVRDRDSMTQERIAIAELVAAVRDRGIA